MFGLSISTFLKALGVGAVLGLAILLYIGLSNVYAGKEVRIEASPWKVLRRDQVVIGAQTRTITMLKDTITGHCYIETSTGHYPSNTAIAPIDCPK